MKLKLITLAVSLAAIALTSVAFAQKSKKAEVEQIDPLKDFELIVARCVTSNKKLENERVAYNERTKKWGKQVNSTAKITYDVKRTDSLVSPFSGRIDIVSITFLESAETEDAAKAKPISPENSTARESTFNMNYAMQGGKWIATGGNSIHVLRMYGKWQQSDKFTSNIDLSSPTLPNEIKECVL